MGPIKFSIQTERKTKAKTIATSCAAGRKEEDGAEVLDQPWKTVPVCLGKHKRQGVFRAYGLANRNGA